MKKKKLKKSNPEKREKESAENKKEREIKGAILKLTTIDIIAIIIITGFYGYIYLTNISAYDSLMYDEAGYITMGRTLAVEHYHGIDVQGTKESYRQPFFPMMLAASFLIFGVSYTAAKIPIIASAILTMLIIYLLVKEMYNREIAFFSSAMLGGIPLILPYVQNILSDIPSVLFYTIAMLAFYIGIEKKKPKYLYISWLSFGLTFLIRYNAILIIPSIAIYLTIKIITNQTSLKDLAKNRDLILSPLAALIPLAPYFIYQHLTFGDAFIGIKQARGALNMQWGAGAWHTYLTQAPQYLTWLGFTLAILGIIWTLYKKDKFAIFMLTWIIVPLAYFSIQILKDLRLIDTLAPPLAILAALGAFKIIAKLTERDLKLTKTTSLILPSIMLIYIIYTGYTAVLPRYQQIHALGYPSLQESGDWIQQNTNKDAVLMTASEPGHQWYSYRKTVGYPAKQEQLINTIHEKNIDYIIIDDYERMQPQYMVTLYYTYFAKETGELRHKEDEQKIKIAGDRILFDQYRGSTTIIIPKDLFIERINEQQ
ncbi:MAG: glycosyltransferase family 39 protein [archaeon]|nr:glycosyltransferase family 39 protein [archaeon]